MLDLTKINYLQTRYELKMLDGEVLKIKQPTQRMIEGIMNFNKSNEEDDEETLMTKFRELFLDIINLNDAHKVYTDKDLGDYSYQLIAYVIKNYYSFWNTELAKVVDFQ